MKYVYKHRNNKPPKISIKIDQWDAWSIDYTISHIMIPLIDKLIEDRWGSPYTDDEDVPEGIRSIDAGPKENDYDTDEFHDKRWIWILEEIQWGFKQIADNEEEGPDYDGPVFSGKILVGPEWKIYCSSVLPYEARIDNSMRLFGKYLRAMWT